MAATAASCASSGSGESDGADRPLAGRPPSTTPTTPPEEPEAAATRVSCCSEGDLDLYVMAKSPFDPYADDPYWGRIGAYYDRMVVWSSFWDSRLEHYDDVVAYTNAYSIKVNTDSDRRSVEHPEWVLRDARGEPVYIRWGCDDGCPQFAADLGNPAFVADWIARAEDLVDLGYPGLYIDDVNMEWRFSDVDGESIEPIDPRTGEPLTLDTWRRYMAEFTERVRREFPDLEIWHNSIWYADSPEFDDEYVTRQIESADVIQLERGMTDAGLTEGTSKFGMQTFMSFIDRVHDAGTSVALLDETATNEDEQWYNIAGGLLVNDGDDFVTTEHWESIAPRDLFEGYLVDLGDALGPREVVDGTIRREFTDGLVIMNEPGAAPVTVALDGTWRDPSGEAREEVTLGPREAIVLSRVS